MHSVGFVTYTPHVGGRFVVLDTNPEIKNAQGPLKAPCSLEGKKQMPIQLRIRDDLSINDISSLARYYNIKVTPHVGNWTPARLVLPTIGVSILCVDHTIGERDPNAHPHLLIKDGVAHELCDRPDRLTTHSSVTRELPDMAYPIGRSLSDVHVGALRTLYPSADIVTHVEYLKENRDITLAVLEEITALSRSATWWRRVDQEGNVTAHRKKELPRTWGEVEQDIFPLTREKEGWLVHNRVSILMDVILQSRMGTEPEVYHLSGPDMVRYLGGEIEVISRMYDHVQKRLGFKQESVSFNLIPFASFRFATRTKQAGACERICEGLVTGSPTEDVLRQNIAEASDALAESESKNYFTQHDCLAQGDCIVVPDVARTWSMATCATHLATVRALM